MIHISRKDVHAQACPECGARPGDPCVMPNGTGSMFMATFHTARVEAARSAAAEAAASRPSTSDARPESPLMPPRRRRADPLEVSCEVCGVGPGTPCRDFKGRAREEPHAFRKTAAHWVERGIERAAGDSP